VVVRTGGTRSAEQVELTQVTLVLEAKKQTRSVADAARELLEKAHPKKDWSVEERSGDER
jgi:hypothetical protein